jgi:hypothetical protein
LVVSEKDNAAAPGAGHQSIQPIDLVFSQFSLFIAGVETDQ